MTNIEHFKSLDIRVGTIVRAEFLQKLGIQLINYKLILETK